MIAIWAGIKTAAKYWYLLVIGLLVLYVSLLKVHIANDTTSITKLTDSNTSLQNAAREYNQSVDAMQKDTKAIAATAASAVTTVAPIQTQQTKTIVQIQKEVIPSDCESSMKNLVVSLKKSDQGWSN
jgi:hypothetical protein